MAADVLARRLDGMMTEPWTARQVRERASASLAEVCAEWAASGPRLEARPGGGGRDELSRAHLLALGWDAAAEPYVDHLHVFGPAAADVVE